MKKSVLTSMKLRLSKETLRELQDDLVKEAAGGDTQVRHCTIPFTTWPTCDPIG